MLTTVLCLPAAMCAALSLADEEVVACDRGQETSTANLALGVVHPLMALYLQTKLFHGLQQRDVPLTAADGRDLAASEQTQARVLMERAGHVVLYDVLFCLYIFVFVGSFVFQLVALSWASSCGSSSPLPYAAATLLLLFGMMASCFGSCWWFAMLCGDCCSRGALRGLFGFLFGRPSASIVQGAPVGPAYLQGVPVQPASAPEFLGTAEPSAPPPPPHEAQHPQGAQGTGVAFAGAVGARAADSLSRASRWLGGRRDAGGQ